MYRIWQGRILFLISLGIPEQIEKKNWSMIQVLKRTSKQWLQNFTSEHHVLRKAQLKLPPKALLEASDILIVAEGLGISGANENTDLSLQQYKQLIDSMNKKRRDKKLKNKNQKLLLGIHGAESRESVEFSKSLTGKTEVFRIMRFLKPDYIVHMTNATDEDISLVARSRTGVVICPRANGGTWSRNSKGCRNVIERMYDSYRNR